MSSRQDVSRIRAIPDSLARAKAATDLLTDYQQASVELARLRREAVELTVRDTGMNYSEVARHVGLSKGRIAQIRRTAPPPHRALFGVGPVTVAIPVRPVSGRQLGAVALEDSLSADLMTATLGTLAIESRPYQIPIDGQWQIKTDAVIVCGPKSSSKSARLIGDDPHFDFSLDEHDRWTITQKETSEIFVSGIDAHPGTPSDLAYVSGRTVEDRRLILIAGVHAIGSLGAATYLSEHADALYEQAGLRDFTAVIRCAFEGSTITRTDLATSIQTW